MAARTASESSRLMATWLAEASPAGGLGLTGDCRPSDLGLRVALRGTQVEALGVLHAP